MRAILIGGTSHLGKSYFAEALAHRLGWQYMSTDSLSRHPGRPWKKECVIPVAVQNHYLTNTPNELVDDVIQHYGKSVWPIVKAIVQTRVFNQYDSCIVLEGSAILPEPVASADFEQTLSVWFTASEDLIKTRIHKSSRYHQKSPRGRKMIDRFLSRSLLFNEHILAETRRLDQHSVDISQADAVDQLLAKLSELDGKTSETAHT